MNSQIKNNLPFVTRFIRYNRLFRDSLHNPRTDHPIIVNSVAKSGTHLAMKALELFPGIWRSPIQFGRQHPAVLAACGLFCPGILPALLIQYSAQKQNSSIKGNGVPIDSDSPFWVPKERVKEIFDLFRPGWAVMGHLPYSRPLEQLVTKHNVKMLLIIRDPRDVIVSHAQYLAQKKTHYMNKHYRSLTRSERIDASIHGVPPDSEHPELLDIRNRLQMTLEWRDKPFTYTTRFEHLVGPQGAGSEEMQLKELHRMSNHLDVKLPAEELRAIATQIFGGTRTFRRGSGGQWEHAFLPKHRHACKDLIGDLLIELDYETSSNW